MKHLVQKAMISLACAIIMLHAVVPHHHHDCHNAIGLTFETEVGCHCDSNHHHDHRHTHHPYNICLLQDMLSHLEFSTCDDHHSSAALIKAEASSYLVLAIPCLVLEQQAPVLPVHLLWWPSGTVPPIVAPLVGTMGLRAPPTIA